MRENREINTADNRANDIGPEELAPELSCLNCAQQANWRSFSLGVCSRNGYSIMLGLRLADVEHSQGQQPGNYAPEG